MIIEFSNLESGQQMAFRTFIWLFGKKAITTNGRCIWILIGKCSDQLEGYDYTYPDGRHHDYLLKREKLL